MKLSTPEGSAAASIGSRTPKRIKTDSPGTNGDSSAGGKAVEVKELPSFGNTTPRDKIASLVQDCKDIMEGFTIREAAGVTGVSTLLIRLENAVATIKRRNQTLRYNEVSVFDKALVHLFEQEKLPALILYIAEYSGIVQGGSVMERCQAAMQSLQETGAIIEVPVATLDDLSGSNPFTPAMGLAASAVAYSSQPNLISFADTPAHYVGSGFLTQAAFLPPGSGGGSRLFHPGHPIPHGYAPIPRVVTHQPIFADMSDALVSAISQSVSLGKTDNEALVKDSHGQDRDDVQRFAQSRLSSHGTPPLSPHFDLEEFLSATHNAKPTAVAQSDAGHTGNEWPDEHLDPALYGKIIELAAAGKKRSHPDDDILAQ